MRQDRRIPPQPNVAHAALVAAALVVFTLAAACAGEENAGPVTAITSPPREWRTLFAAPLHIDIDAKAATAMTITVTPLGDEGVEAVKNVSLPGPARTRMEISAVPLNDATVVCEGAGWRESTTVYSHSPLRDEGEFSALLCVDAHRLREITALVEAQPSSRIDCGTTALSNLPRRWQSYLGCRSIILLSTADASRLGREQRQALRRWVHWLGGVVWLDGPDAEQTARDLGLARDGQTGKRNGGIKRIATASGSVLLGDGTGQDDVVKAIVAGFPALDPLTRIYTQSYRAQSFARGMAEGLGRLPVLYIALALICMGLLLGPINFWYVKRKRRALLFFITTPLIALIGTAAIYVLSLLGEGGGRFIQYALLGTAADGGEAFVIDARMIRTGFFQPTPTFVDDAAIMPLPQGYQRKLYQIDTTDGVTLESGWLPPRLVSGIVSARPVVSRLNIELVPDGEDFKLINNLGFSIVTVAALLPGGGIGWAQAVPPGGETVLRRENNRTRFDRLLGKVAEMTGPDGWQQARLVAECDGLPYLDDGGLGGVCESGVYMYCQLGGIGEETRP